MLRRVQLLLSSLSLFRPQRMMSTSTSSSAVVTTLANDREEKQAEERKSCVIDEALVPTLIVFDLDMCCWSPEMYTLDDLPTKDDCVIGKFPHLKNGETGVLGVKSGRSVVRLFPGALAAIEQVYSGKLGSSVKLAVASSADTPRAVEIANACISLLEVAPGVTFRQALQNGWPDGFSGNLQIGRSFPLSGHKHKSHFPILKDATKIPYNQMLFFDDCNWEDNVGLVEKFCPGVVGIRTPKGMQVEEFEAGLKKFAAVAAAASTTGKKATSGSSE